MRGLGAVGAVDEEVQCLRCGAYGELDAVGAVDEGGGELSAVGAMAEGNER